MDTMTILARQTHKPLGIDNLELFSSGSWMRTAFIFVYIIIFKKQTSTFWMEIDHVIQVMKRVKLTHFGCTSLHHVLILQYNFVSCIHCLSNVFRCLRLSAVCLFVLFAGESLFFTRWWYLLYTKLSLIY